MERSNFDERPWRGFLAQGTRELDSVQTTLNFAQTMTWKGKSPQVRLIQTHYSTGVRLTKQEMKEIESQIQRLPHLPNWFVDIFPVFG